MNRRCEEETRSLFEKKKKTDPDNTTEMVYDHLVMNGKRF